LINASPDEFDVIRQALLPHKEHLIERLWGVANAPRNDQQYLCAVSSLAIYTLTIRGGVRPRRRCRGRYQGESSVREVLDRRLAGRSGQACRPLE